MTSDRIRPARAQPTRDQRLFRAGALIVQAWSTTSWRCRSGAWNCKPLLCWMHRRTVNRPRPLQEDDPW